MIYDCEICGELAHRITLVGGHNAHLCLAHERAWHDYVVQTPAFKEYRDAKRTYEAFMAAVSSGTGDVHLTIETARDRDQVYLELYRLAKTWLNEQRGG